MRGGVALFLPLLLLPAAVFAAPEGPSAAPAGSALPALPPPEQEPVISQPAPGAPPETPRPVESQPATDDAPPPSAGPAQGPVVDSDERPAPAEQRIHLDPLPRDHGFQIGGHIADSMPGGSAGGSPVTQLSDLETA